MIIVAGCVIVKKDKILMVQEAQKKCYGQYVAWTLSES